MRDPHATFERFEKVADIWIASLDSYSPAQFAATPDSGAWSIGQVYQHLITTVRGMQMRNIEMCIAGEGEPMRGGKTFPGRMTFTFGRLPPVRIRVPPSKEYTPTQPAEPAPVRTALEEVIVIVRDAREPVARASAASKTRHPVLGMLNAAEWYQLIEIHFRHHLRQKKRLDAFLGIR